MNNIEIENIVINEKNIKIFIETNTQIKPEKLGFLKLNLMIIFLMKI
jgi:hypothetical protein